MEFNEDELKDIVEDAFYDANKKLGGDFEIWSENDMPSMNLEYPVIHCLEYGGLFENSNSKLRDKVNEELLRYRDIMYKDLCEENSNHESFEQELSDWGYNSGKDFKDMKFIDKMGSYDLKKAIEDFVGTCAYNGELYFYVRVNLELPNPLTDTLIINYSMEEMYFSIMEIPSSVINYEGLSEKELHDLIVDEVVSVCSKY